jgi:SNF2 family DNA or RNA helicase
MAADEALKKVRDASTFRLKPASLLKPDIELRTYQHQMVYHMLTRPNFICGDDTGLGKTLSAIATLCYLWEKQPEKKAIVVTTKSALRQWGAEFDKFTTGVPWIIAEGPAKKRQKIYENFFKTDDHKVMITNYHRCRNDKRNIVALMEQDRCVLIMDEATAIKSTDTKIHAALKQIAEKCVRVYALTATLIKNNLVDAYGISKIAVPGLFSTKKAFYANYCVTRKQPLPGGGRRFVEVVVGHSSDHIDLFRDKIDNYYLGRAKHDVAHELPLLTTKEFRIPVTTSQWNYYVDAEDGLLTLYEGEEDEEERETTKLTRMGYFQQIVNDPALIGNEGESPKVNFLFDLLEEEFPEDKVIIFSRYRSMIDILQERAEKKGYQYALEGSGSKAQIRSTIKNGFARITGSEGGQDRELAKKAFTENDNMRIMFLTLAGAEAMNLQQASALIFFDLPWSAGDYLQILGRMIRIGSPHQNVYAIHLLAESPFGGRTIDDHVAGVLTKKMGFIRGALGDRIAGKEKEVYHITNDANDIFNSMFDEARRRKVK